MKAGPDQTVRSALFPRRAVDPPGAGFFPAGAGCHRPCGTTAWTIRMRMVFSCCRAPDEPQRRAACSGKDRPPCPNLAGLAAAGRGPGRRHRAGAVEGGGSTALAHAVGSVLAALGLSLVGTPIIAAQWRLFLPRQYHVPGTRVFEILALSLMSRSSLPFLAGHASSVGLLVMRGGIGPGAAVLVMTWTSFMPASPRWGWWPPPWPLPRCRRFLPRRGQP